MNKKGRSMPAFCEDGFSAAEVELDPASTPEEIEARSFAIIDDEVPEPRPFSGGLWQVARCCIHTVGDIGILSDLRLDERGLVQGVEALLMGCTVFTDTRMAADGMPLRRMRPLGVTVTAIMSLPGLEEKARAMGTTRSRAGMAALEGMLAGQIVVIGNAPTALLALLDALGFVNAAQSKTLLHRGPWPHFTVLGRRGGSALAAACVNALAEIALERKNSGFAQPQGEGR